MQTFLTPRDRLELNALHRASVWLTEVFDRTLRPLMHDPERIVHPFVGPGDRVADIGCGAGYFSPALSRLVGPHGELLVVDAQEAMLERAFRRVREDPTARSGFTGVLVSGDELQLPPNIDFALMFWVLHEVEECTEYWRTLRHAIRPTGKVLVTEPHFHVNARRWEEELAPATEEFGFARSDIGGIAFSRAAVLTRR